MKKKSSKTKTKDRGQFRNLAITILTVVILVIVVINAKGFRIGAGEATNSDNLRVWPSFLLKELEDDPLLPDLSMSANQKGGVIPASPGPTDIATPYSFVKITSNNLSYLYGSVYYTSGGEVPKLLNNANFASAIPSGDYVFSIYVDSFDPVTGKPLSTTPVKIDTRPGSSYGLMTPLDTTSNWPDLWNALVPAKDGDDYVYTAMNADITSPNYLTGRIIIVRDKIKYAEYNESVLQPALSSDGTQVTWVSKIGDRSKFGRGDLYTLNLDTSVLRRIYDANSTQECAGPSLSYNGGLQAFSLIGPDPISGVRRQYIYVNGYGAENKPIDMTQLPIGTYYNWNSNVKINDSGSGIVWQGKKERVMGPGNRGYNILAAAIYPINAHIGDAFEIMPYDGSQRRRLPDLDNDGFVIFSNWMGETAINYAIYGTKAFKNAPIFSIFKSSSMNFGATFSAQD